jgi:hypothetical protein
VIPVNLVVQRLGLITPYLISALNPLCGGIFELTQKLWLPFIEAVRLDEPASDPMEENHEEGVPNVKFFGPFYLV